MSIGIEGESRFDFQFFGTKFVEPNFVFFITLQYDLAYEYVKVWCGVVWVDGDRWKVSVSFSDHELPKQKMTNDVP